MHTKKRVFVDGPFLSRILIWCQVPLENLTARSVSNLPGSRRMDFLVKESRDAQHHCLDSFNIATDPFAAPFFDRKWHLSPCTQPFSDEGVRDPVAAKGVSRLAVHADSYIPFSNTAARHQPHAHALALKWLISLDESSHLWVPARHPRHTQNVTW